MNSNIIKSFNRSMELVSFYKFLICELLNSSPGRIMTLALSIRKLKKQFGLLFFNEKIRQNIDNASSSCFVACCPSVNILMFWIVRFFKILYPTKSLIKQIYNFGFYLFENYARCMLRGFRLGIWGTHYCRIAIDRERTVTIQASSKISHQILIHSLIIEQFIPQVKFFRQEMPNDR